MQMLRVLLILSFLFFCTQVFAESWVEDINSKGYARLNYQERTIEDKNTAKLREQMDARFEIDWSRNDFKFDSVSYFKYRGQYADANKSVREDMQWDAGLREWIFNYDASNWLYKLGSQQVAWGKGDYFRIVDVINPLDLREGLLTYIDDYALGRQPRNMLVIEHYRDDMELQVITAFEHKQTQYAPADTDFTVDAYPQGVQVKTDDLSPDVGIRMRWFLDGTDLDLYGFDGYDPDPKYELNNANELSGELIRRQLLALSFARPIEFGVLRSDLAYYPQETIQLTTRYDTIQKVDALLGLDIQENEWTFNLQGAVSQYLNVSDEFTSNDRITSASVFVEKQWSRQRLTSSVLCLYNYQDASSTMLKFLVRYDWFNNSTVEGGVINFDGPETTLHGMYDDQDRLYVALKYSF